MEVFVLLNDLIRQVAEAGLSGAVYDGFMLVNIIALAVFALQYRKKYSLTAKQTILILVIAYPLCFLWILLFAWAESGFRLFGDKNMVRGFVYFPIITMLPARILKIRKEVIWDFLVPCFALVNGVQHLGCIFAGCCHGYPSSWGLWNPILKQILFPIQLIESLASLSICVICVLAAKKEHYAGSGKIYPLFLVIFGSTRFVFELLRDYNNVWGSLTNLSFHAALMTFVGIVWLCYIWDKEARTAKRKVKHSSK